MIMHGLYTLYSIVLKPRENRISQRFGMSALLSALLCITFSAAIGNGGERRSGPPPLLSAHTLPPPRENPDSNIDPQPDRTQQDDDRLPEKNKREKRRLFGRRAPTVSDLPESDTAKPPAAIDVKYQEVLAREGFEYNNASGDTVPDYYGNDETTAEEDCIPDFATSANEQNDPPTPEAVENYRLKLECRLLERYNNLPEYAGSVAKVSVVLSRPVDVSMDGKLIRAEFDQLVYDNWGKRLPALEKEYYMVTFGTGGAQLVRSDPSIRVGLDMEKVYSERVPLVANPFGKIEDSHSFKPAPVAKMPGWWRPEFPELD